MEVFPLIFLLIDNQICSQSSIVQVHFLFILDFYGSESVISDRSASSCSDDLASIRLSRCLFANPE